MPPCRSRATASTRPTVSSVGSGALPSSSVWLEESSESGPFGQGAGPGLLLHVCLEERPAWATSAEGPCLMGSSSCSSCSTWSLCPSHCFRLKNVSVWPRVTPSIFTARPGRLLCVITAHQPRRRWPLKPLPRQPRPAAVGTLCLHGGRTELCQPLTQGSAGRGLNRPGFCS